MTDMEMVQAIFAAAVDAVKPQKVLPAHLARTRELFARQALERLVVLAFGKAAVPMALTAEELLGEAITAGLAIAPHGTLPRVSPERIEIATAAHPFPDEAGVAATRRLMDLAREADSKTLLLLLVSGGGSSLLVAPADGITLTEKQQTSRLLMEAGGNIEELNAVRKHLSAVKGGRLAELAHPATVLTLAISDVAGERADVIASGPAVPDPSTFGDALVVLERLGVTAKVPAAVLTRLREGSEGRIPETPKPGDPVSEKASTAIIASNRDARKAAAGAARGFGLAVRVLEDEVSGEARLAGDRLAVEALRVKAALAPGERLCLISGGETTVRVVGKGKGGRNQELALAFALAVAGEGGVTLLSAGTDGIDGPTDAAGAIVDGNTVATARGKELSPEAALEENDAYPLLESCSALLKSGPTGTNVRDIQIVIISG